jgi:hypothetical protein
MTTDTFGGARSLRAVAEKPGRLILSSAANFSKNKLIRAEQSPGGRGD